MKTFTTLIAASSIALSSISAAPAQADPDKDLLLFLGAVAAIALLAKNNAHGSTPAPAGPVTHSTGPLDVPQTYLFDLDRGRVTNNGNSDIWFEAETRRKLYLTPRNGAEISVGSGAQRGFDGCSSAIYTTQRTRLRSSDVGEYVCVRTSQNRISEFRINDLTAGSPKNLKIGYTTWE